MDLPQHVGTSLYNLHRLEIEVGRLKSVDLLFEL